MKILGVDPGGASGALAIIEQTNGAPTVVVSVIDVPLVGSGARQLVDTIALQEWLLQHKLDIAFIERSQVMPKQGASSGFKYGRMVGALEITIIICSIAFEIIEPGKWKKFFHFRGGDKEAARQRALELFPSAHAALARKKDHGRAEAMLIALYGLRTSSLATTSRFLLEAESMPEKVFGNSME